MGKIVLGIVIVLFGGLCGYVCTKRFRKRALFFRQFYDFNERFINEISYYKRSLDVFLSGYNYRGEFNELLEAYKEDLAMPEKFLKALRDNELFFFLKNEEKKFIFDYFSMLGKGDSFSQKSCFIAQKEGIVALRNAAEATAKKYGDLYLKIGILCGLLFLILIL